MSIRKKQPPINPDTIMDEMKAIITSPLFGEYQNSDFKILAARAKINAVQATELLH